jgi:chemotaxis protein methyltransferase CheR
MTTMQTTLSLPLLSQLSEFVATHTGLHFPQERWGDLERGIAKAAPDFKFSDMEACARWLLSAPLSRHMNEVLASHLSIGETYFLREKQSLEVFEEYILPELVQSRRQNERRLRIWSAGCSTGEEAYTIAILLDRLVPDLKDWHVTILATDFNPVFLRKAAQGIYGEWSFRDAPAWLRERYFTRAAKGRMEIIPRIRKMVTFSYLNFAEDVYPSLLNNTSAMDVVFCRNVLMYFTEQHAKQVTGNFYRALVEGGWLIVSPVESSSALLAPFRLVEFPGAVLYQKTSNRESRKQNLKSRASEYPFMKSFMNVLEIPSLENSDDFPSLPSVIPEEPAIVDIPAVQSGEEDKELPLEMARSCANQGRLAEALEWCTKAIAADKMNPLHHYLNATILQEQGQHAAAIESLIRALYIEPRFVLAHFTLGNLYQSQGRYREAQHYFGNVLLLLRNHPPDETLPEADGLTAGRLAEIVTSLQASLPQSAASNV